MYKKGPLSGTGIVSLFGPTCGKSKETAQCEIRNKWKWKLLALHMELPSSKACSCYLYLEGLQTLGKPCGTLIVTEPKSCELRCTVHRWAETLYISSFTQTTVRFQGLKLLWWAWLYEWKAFCHSHNIPVPISCMGMERPLPLTGLTAIARVTCSLVY